MEWNGMEWIEWNYGIIDYGMKLNKINKIK